MRKKGFLTIILMVLVFPVLAIAQKQPSLWQGERALQKLSAIPNPKIKQFLCGDYFLFGPTNTTKDPTLRIGFILEKRPTDPDFLRLSCLFLPSNCLIIIDDTKSVPTAQLIFSKQNQDKIIIRISKKDYQNSSCLRQISPKGNYI